MACGSGGCSSGGCSSGGCNKLSTHDWLSDYVLPDEYPNKNFIEVSFKNGVRKDVFVNDENLELSQGMMVAVQAAAGHDVGEVSLTGVLAELQHKKVKSKKDKTLKVYRIATKNDIIKMEEAREKEQETLVRSRKMAKELGLDMKIGEVEFQADSKKVTFYYTAEGRVDFRELVKVFAKEFKSKIEMKQIGLRQEAAKIGGIGSCGRELCCSTWLTDFKVVSTQAARYQNLAINTARLSGQCGRLKCCLNFELDCYMEAYKEFPKGINTIVTKRGPAKLIKTDILLKKLFYTYKESPTLYEVELEEILEKLEEIKDGITPEDFTIGVAIEEEQNEDTDLVGHISISQLEKKSKRKKNTRNRNRNRNKRDNKRQNSPTNSEKKDQIGQAEVSSSGKKRPSSRKPKASKNKGENAVKGPQSNKGSNNKNRRPNKPKGENKKPIGEQNSNKPENTSTSRKQGNKNNNRRRNNRPKGGKPNDSNNPKNENKD